MYFNEIESCNVNLSLVIFFFLLLLFGEIGINTVKLPEDTLKKSFPVLYVKCS